MHTARRGSAARIGVALLAVTAAAPVALAHKGHREAREERSAPPAGEQPATGSGEGATAPGKGTLGGRTGDAAARPAGAANAPTTRSAPAGGEPSAAPHEEEREAWPPPGVPRPLAWLGKFHPPATHFPIALLTAAVLAELLALVRPNLLYAHAARFCVLLGGIGALGAAVLGWFFGGFTFDDDEWVMTAHRISGTATAVVAVVAAILSERFHRGGGGQRAYLATLFAAAALVGLTGFFGGALVYGLDHYTW